MAEHTFVLLNPDEYDRAKKILNAAKHPGFVGRELFFRCATKGRVCVCVVDSEDAGVCFVAADKVQALSVAVKHQGRGVGQALMAHLKPRFVNAIGERVGWFEKIGYAPVGAAKVGQNGKHITQLMERSGEAATESVAIVDRKPGGKPTTKESEDIGELLAKTRGKLDDKTVTILLAAAERGLPKQLAAPLARISRQTLHAWLTSAEEPYASFAAEYRAAMARAGGNLVDTVTNTDPKWLLAVVHKLRPPPERREVTGKDGKPLHGTDQYTDAELEAELERRGYQKKTTTEGDSDDA